MPMTIRGREYEIWTGGSPQTYRRIGPHIPCYISRVPSPYGTVFVVTLETKSVLFTSLEDAIGALDAWDAAR